MNRPWFAHNTKQLSDHRIKKVRYKYGIAGYGMYWYIMEELAMNQTRVHIDHFKNLEDVDNEKIIDIITSFSLLSIENNIVSCKELRVKNNIDRSKERMHQYNVNMWYDLRDSIFKRDDYTCAYCGQRGGVLEADHVIPFSRGGADDESNLVTSCRRCNRQKKDKTVSEFNEWRARRK